MNRQTTITVLTLLAIAVAGLLVYMRIIDQQPPRLHETVVCENCQNVFEVELRGKGGGAPYMCPRCGQVAAYLAFQCENPNCRTIFPVRPEAMASGQEIVCPVCGEPARRVYGIPPRAEELARQIKEAAP
jgi:rRNA maturation endonuclease Nob1